ncbi:hypothetical protein [uncultured Rhodospira sp.]|uniref:hypothetical protein n=1 Tax=uncultured Rhodospira sp. TaxID=1936189 RepID=UPI00262637AB|nr:hypothetical protein [uncultured Rhodospira sp.]
MTSVWLATEDSLSEAVAERLLTEATPGVEIALRFGGRGCGYLKTSLPKFINMAHRVPGLVLTDLDQTDCPHTLIAAWFKGRPIPEGILFRIAVREVEAWLMADKDGFAAFSGIPKVKLPQDVEGVRDPKEHLLGLVRRHAPKNVKMDLLPLDPSQTARTGMNYNDRLIDFVRRSDGWNPARAAANADSLRRARERLAALRVP